MRKTFSISQIQEILGSGNFELLIGGVENEVLECKQSPYQLQNEDQKYELAKDVCGLANASGGYILLGVSTERSPVELGDKIVEISAFPESLVDRQQCHNILDDWIYPPLRQVQITWYPKCTDKERGIVAILVPNGIRSERPFLLTKTLLASGKRTEILFGCVERHRAGIQHHSVQELHARLRDGFRFKELDQRYENIEQALARLAQSVEVRDRGGGSGASGQAPSESDLLKIIQHRADGSLQEGGFAGLPVLGLSAIPLEQTEVPSLFESRHCAIVKLLEDPPEIRDSGFDLDAGETSVIVRGQLRRVVTPGYKLLELWRDGLLRFAGSGGDDFLCWTTGSSEKTGLVINPYVLSEATYLFAELLAAVREFTVPKSKSYRTIVSLRNMTLGEKPAVLIPYELNTAGWRSRQDKRLAPNSDVSASVVVSDFTPGTVAFKLLAELYLQFGIENDRIPYTELVEGERQVTKAKLLGLKPGRSN